MRYAFVSSSPDDTMDFGIRLGRLLKPGDIICLEGELGAGKTLLAQGIAAGMGIKQVVTSPTFTLINQYPGETPLFHFDVYRLQEGEELYHIGGEELLYGQGVSVIEWPSRVMDILPEERLWIRISRMSDRDSTRLIEITAKGDRYRSILEGAVGNEDTGD